MPDETGGIDVKYWCVCMAVLLVLGASLLPARAQDGGTAGDADTPMATPTAADKTLAARAFELARKAQGTMGQEQANFLLNDWPRGVVNLLTGDKPIKAKELSEARGMAKGFAEILEKAPTWPQPPSIIVPYTRTAPVIDGTLRDPAWKKALVLHGACALNSTTKVDNTTWRLMWDEHDLYLGVTCADKEVIAPKVGHNGDIYDYDCVEFFLLPDFSTRQYWELEVGATGESLRSAQYQVAGSLGRAQ